MTDATSTTPPTKPQTPANASEAAAQLLKWLPRVKNPDNGQLYPGYYKGGKPVFIPMTLDRSLAMGTLQGISEGRVTQGDKSLIGNINVTFIRPLEDAIKEASKGNQIQLENGETSNHNAPSLDITENQRLLNILLNGIDWAASFGIFHDQALDVKRSVAAGFNIPKGRG